MSDFNGARLKLQRAESQAKQIRREFAEWFSVENNPYSLSVENDGSAREWWVVWRVHKPLPEMWPVRIGEIVHNLRSALDHVIYEASAPAPDGNPLAGTEFPIFLEEEPYRKTRRGGGLYKIRGLSPEAKAFVERCQPFTCGNPKGHFLWILQELSNADKHRLLNFASTYNIKGDMIMEWEPAVSGIEWTRLTSQGKLEDGAEFFRICVTGASPDTKADVTGQFAYAVLFDESVPSTAKLPVWRVLEGAGKFVGAVINEFVKL